MTFAVSQLHIFPFKSVVSLSRGCKVSEIHLILLYQVEPYFFICLLGRVTLNSFTMVTEPLGTEPVTTALKLSVFLLWVLFSRSLFYGVKSAKPELPIANRAFHLEPRMFAKLRWAFNARTILDQAYKKASAH